MVVCSWSGFVFYLFAFLFFLVGIFFALFDLITHIVFGFKKGFFVKYGNNKFSNALSNILFFGFMFFISIHIVSVDLPPIITDYWKCLRIKGI